MNETPSIDLITENAKNKVFTFASAFKKFISKGNVIDMAVGVIIGAAFGKIVSSLVADIIMPVMGVLLGKVNFNDLKIVIQQQQLEGTVVVVPEVSILYGKFIQFTFDFLIVAIAIFIVLKVVFLLKKKEENAPVEPPPPSQTEILLTEIRDLLKKQDL